MTPLIELGSAQYLGFAGGLYPNGKNSPPSAYEDAGVALGATMKPLDRDGKPSASGKIVYRDRFHAALLEFIEWYRGALPSDAALQAAFIRKFDSLCQ